MRSAYQLPGHLVTTKVIQYDFPYTHWNFRQSEPTKEKGYASGYGQTKVDVYNGPFVTTLAENEEKQTGRLISLRIE